MNRSRRYGSAVAVCMVRLFFSESDDWEREKCSLERIEATARQLSGQLRKFDTICRYDVHTFSILMPETDLDSAFEVCARLREVILAESGEEMAVYNGSWHCVTLRSFRRAIESAVQGRSPAFPDIIQKQLMVFHDSRICFRTIFNACSEL